NSLVNRFGARAFLSPIERAFIDDPSPTQHVRVQFAWRYECLWILLWALGYVETLERPDKICDVPKAVRHLRNRCTAEFICNSRLRSIAELLDEADLIYRYHWAVAEGRLKERPGPAGLEPDVVQERHHALNWLIGHLDQEWDKISTDT
ncbi:MAG: hypothetical protein JWM99_3907, partial [Verrucomicrobiales bacterium]|nr:hypothetical protein [Verrucomicrobiales bacterium]